MTRTTAALLTATALALSGCGGTASDSAVADAPVTAATTAAAPPDPSSPAAPAPAPSDVVPVAPTEDMVDFVMPDLVGIDLQTAQDTIQELGVFFSVSHDLLGSRNQVLDSNWLVCDSTPLPGTRVQGAASDLEGSIDFGVVKREETCP